MSIEKVGTFDGETLRGWVIDQTDGSEVTLTQLTEADSVFHDVPHFGEIDESVPDDGALEVFVPDDPDEPPVQIETVPIAGEPVTTGRVPGRRPSRSGQQIDKPGLIVQQAAGSSDTQPEPEVVEEDRAALTDEVVANVADPQDVRPISNAARRARGAW